MRYHLCTERTTRDQERCPGRHSTKPDPDQILLHLQQLVVVWSKEKNLSISMLFVTVVNWVSQLCPFLNASCLPDRSLYSSLWAMIFEHLMCSSNLQGTCKIVRIFPLSVEEPPSSKNNPSPYDVGIKHSSHKSCTVHVYLQMSLYTQFMRCHLRYCQWNF